MRVVLLSSIALRQFNDLDESQRTRIKLALNAFASDGRGDVKKLKGTKGRESLYRLRVGEYRINLAQHDEKILVTQIIPRSHGYDWL
jgi:mRNA interferase RelE/StbE